MPPSPVGLGGWVVPVAASAPVPGVVVPVDASSDPPAVGSVVVGGTGGRFRRWGFPDPGPRRRCIPKPLPSPRARKPPSKSPSASALLPGNALGAPGADGAVLGGKTENERERRQPTRDRRNPRGPPRRTKPPLRVGPRGGARRSGSRLRHPPSTHLVARLNGRARSSSTSFWCRAEHDLPKARREARNQRFRGGRPPPRDRLNQGFVIEDHEP